MPNLWHETFTGLIKSSTKQGAQEWILKLQSRQKW
jgi:hypothetical protein